MNPIPNFGRPMAPFPNFGQTMAGPPNLGQSPNPTANFGASVGAPGGFGQSRGGAPNFGPSMASTPGFGQSMAPGGIGQSMSRPGEFGQSMMSSAPSFNKSTYPSASLTHSMNGTASFSRTMQMAMENDEMTGTTATFGKQRSLTPNFSQATDPSAGATRAAHPAPNFPQAPPNFPKAPPHPRGPGMTQSDPATMRRDHFPHSPPTAGVAGGPSRLSMKDDGARVVSDIRRLQRKPAAPRVSSKEEINRRIVNMIHEIVQVLGKCRHLETARRLRFWHRLADDHVLTAIAAQAGWIYSRTLAMIHFVGDQALMAECHARAGPPAKPSLLKALTSDIAGATQMLGDYLDVLSENFASLDADARAFLASGGR